MRKNIATLVILVAGLTALAFSPYLREMQWTPLRIAGLALAIAALPLFILARLQLGSSFSIRAQATALVTHGLYARIRNPVYVFGSLLMLGIILVVNIPYLLLLFLIIVPMQVVRSRKEAKVLEDKFGDAYREYTKRTWF